MNICSESWVRNWLNPSLKWKTIFLSLNIHNTAQTIASFVPVYGRLLAVDNSFGIEFKLFTNFGMPVEY